MSPFDHAPAQRLLLGQRLRELRERAGLSGAELARRTGIVQSKVSRVETGRLLPSDSDLDAWLTAAGADEVERVRAAELREKVAVEAITWRRLMRQGLGAVQAEVKAMEAACTLVREYHPVLVPGLLQAPGYAQAVAEARHGIGHPNVAAWVAAVLDRQQLLAEPGRRFEFVVGEAALRWRPGPAEMMAGQLHHLGVMASLPNVSVRVLRFDQPVPMWRSHHFTMFEQADGQALVHLELLAGGENLRDPDDLARFAEAFERLQAAAVPWSAKVLAAVAADLGR
jgi:transcriptional regulator with XRE-family HTH domain